MSCNCTPGSTCNCCAGTSIQTPQLITNTSGQPVISYRTGTWAQFKESMLARLSSAEYPALAGLKTRDDDDFTIAFLDASAVMLDILSFYQERLANESYLRTAQQLQSLTELSQLIGYQPAPGIAASVYVAFTLKTTPGAPSDPTTPPIIIPIATQVQSVPGQGQTPQTFETSAPIPAKADWNALPVLAALPWSVSSATGMYLQGTATQLNPGDLILMLGAGRSASAPNTDWTAQFLTTVTTDTANNRTWIAWSSPLSSASSLVSTVPKLFVFRQRAALFGYNAIEPYMVSTTALPSFPAAGDVDWPGMSPSSTIDLDGTYSKVVTGSWVLLTQPGYSYTETTSGLLTLKALALRSSPSLSGISIFGGTETVTYPAATDLYKASSVATVSRSDFAMSAKITRITPDTTNDLSNYSARDTAVFAQSDQLTPALQPLDYPLYGTLLDIQSLRPDLVGATVVAVSGTAQKISLNAGVANLQFVPDDPTANPVGLNAGDTFTLIQPPPLPFNSDNSIPSWSSSTYALTLKVTDASGRTGTLQGATAATSLYLSNFSLVAPAKSDAEISEYALVNKTVSPIAKNSTTPNTQFQLANPLLNCYCRATATVNANVALATAGATVKEIMGNGSAATPDQSFTLRQTPLTYVQASTPNGYQSTLGVRVNGVSWSEVASLYEQPATAQVFTIRNQSNGTSDVTFGDGVEGATLPTGQNNIIGTYRIGSGSAGNVAAGAITTLMQRPLGVSGVTNPQAATGGADPESIDDVRSNAPQTVLTLGRAVSIADYQNFAAIFAGIAKAYAIWVPSGPARGVFLTVASVGGVALTPGNPTLQALVTALQNYGNPLVPITALSFIETLFGFSAKVKYDPRFDQPTVETQIRSMLTTNYSFANRTFGQGISTDEIAADIQGIAGVIAVNVTNPTAIASSKGGDLANLAGGFTVSNWNSWMSQPVTVPRPSSDTTSRICPYLPVASAQSLPLAAEILVIDPDPKSVVLGVMS
jgi:Baseplate J-like protein